MDRRDAGVTQPRFQPEIEIRRIDADEGGRTLAPSDAQQRAADARQLAIVLEHLDDSHAPPAFAGHHASKPAACIFGPPMPKKSMHPADDVAQRLDQVTGKLVARRLAGDHRHA
jgi:hypothetical protein